MRVVIAGGTGFLGRALRERLAAAGYDLRVLTRRQTADDLHVTWQPDGAAGAWSATLDGARAVVNLAGEGIADARWTATRKAALRESRLRATRSLVSACRQCSQPPEVFVSASAVGYYGAHGDGPVTEDTPPAHDFLGRLAVEWEQEALQASPLARVALVRSGIVLHPSGGALGRMLLPFRLGLGGPIGSGTQYMPWIHLSDWAALVQWIIETPGADNAFNATAPEPVTNAQFARTLGRVLRRPAIIPVPAFALRLALGELSTVLLTGQRAVPARALDLGFRFRFETLEPALVDLLR